MAIEPKKINYDVAIKSTNHTRSYSLPPEVYTSDTAVQFRFNILDVSAAEFTEGGAVTTVEVTTRDGSFFQHVGETSLEGTTVVYDLKEAEGNHAGLAKIQLKINLGGKYFTSDEYEFKILSTIATGVPVEIYVQNWETLTTQANAYLTKMAADIEEFDVALETGVLATNIAAKLTELQTTYAPDIFSMKRQLEHKVDDYASSAELLSNTLTKLNTGKPITVAGVGDSIMDGYYADNNNGYMEILSAALNTKFGVAVTLNNQGISGYTVRDALIYGRVDAIDNTLADLYVISFGHNDIKSGLNSTYTPGYGYPQAQSIADMEHIIRRLRTNHPSSDILLMGEPPYFTTSKESNIALEKYTNEMKSLAVKYSCLFVDMTPIFELNPNYDAELMYDGGHPNEAGHRLIAKELMKFFVSGTIQNPRTYAIQGSSLFDQWRYGKRAWKQISEGTTGDRFKFYGAGWLGDLTTTPGNFVDIAAKCNRIAIEVEMTGNTRLLMVRDSVNWYNDYKFTSVYPSSPSRFWLTIPFDKSSVVNENVGLHSARLYLRAGSLKIHQVWALESSHEFIPCDSPMLTLSPDLTVITNGDSSQINTYYNKYLVPSGLEGSSVTIPFVGTGLGLDCQVQSTDSIFTVTLDGVAQPDIAIGLAGATGMQGGRLLCSGLPFGHHIITLTAKVGNLSKTYIGGFTVLDEKKLEHPQNHYGLAKVGETKTFGVAYDAIPFIDVNGNGIYPTSQKKTGFVLSGTAGENGTWKSEGNRLVY